MTDTVASSPSGTGTLIAGRYRLLERVGSGGMGTVYRARDELLGRDVALKRFHADAPDQAENRRRLSEATVLASLSHPSLVTLFDADVGDDPYLVMEFIDGPTLRHRISASAMPLPDAALMAVDLASALAAVHAAGIVHRDVKPANVMLRPVPPSTPGGRTFHALLADFGVAHLVDGTRSTAPGDVIGTAAYLAPEQVRGERPMPAADVYALGLLLIESIMGRHPFGEGPAAALLLARLTRQPDMPRGVGYGWRSLLEAMTLLDPTARPSAREVAERAGELASRGADAARAAETATTLAATTPIPVTEIAPTEIPHPVPLAGRAARRRDTDDPRRRRRKRTLVTVAAAALAVVALVALGTMTTGAPLAEEPEVAVDVDTVPVTTDDAGTSDVVDPAAPSVPEPDPAPAVPESGGIDPASGPGNNGNGNNGNGNNGNGNGNSGNGNGNSGNGNNGNGNGNSGNGNGNSGNGNNGTGR